MNEVQPIEAIILHLAGLILLVSLATARAKKAVNKDNLKAQLQERLSRKEGDY